MRLKPPQERTAVIMVWLLGGLSHVDTYDPKPDIGSEYRGPFKTIGTKVPGTAHHRAAADAGEDRGQIHGAALDDAPPADIPRASMQMLSGDPDERDKPKPKLPDWMCVANYLRSKNAERTNPLPNYVGGESASGIRTQARRISATRTRRSR